ncbi:MAG: gamma-glutamylcyclotransferase [Phycisphaerae bacterium]|nr:gamma-glutamylcyclotransferase [Phycisphaerae bacterium]MDD5381652.1 gamma-glutamylcyclotransferase [Phycisphaerae bacterium]
MNKEKVNLFVYGSLREPEIFKSVSSLGFTIDRSRTNEGTLLAEPALLPYYRKVTPDNVYFYAVPDASSKIEGFVIYGVPPSAMAEINRYEGKRYYRETVHVNTAKGLIEAQAYLATRESMKKRFGDRFHVNLIHELWLRKRIEGFIKKHTRPGEETTDANLERRAERELLATTERDLVISHYRSDAVSDYYLEHELDRPRPSIKPLRSEPDVAPFVKNYLALVIKQVMLNQLDERVQSQYRFELEHIRTSERYFKRSISLLIALQMINTDDVELITGKALKTMSYQKYDLIDYVKYAVQAADSIFDSRVAYSYLERVRTNFHPGLIPLGAEIELSNLGPATVESQGNSQKKTDPAYDGFRYFHDFWLDVLSWKLGGYIDDHTGETERARRCGFLELAPGRLNIAGELSRPATADPWLLNQLIHEISKFYKVAPHSLHLSFQLRKDQIGSQKVLPLDFVKCLLALGGGLQKQSSGRLWISRMGNDEITQRSDGEEELVFARTSKRKWYLGEDEVADKAPPQATTYTQQYKFIRLDKEINYEPLILCLKGLQIAYNPGDYLSIKQLKASKKLQKDYEELKEWALEPAEIEPQIISRFLDTIQGGLMNERHRRPAHKLHYIDWAIDAIDAQLQKFNKQVITS